MFCTSLIFLYVSRLTVFSRDMHVGKEIKFTFIIVEHKSALMLSWQWMECGIKYIEHLLWLLIVFPFLLLFLDCHMKNVLELLGQDKTICTVRRLGLGKKSGYNTT